ncbi:mariner Mos1 transposase [Trichonephila clavipes]|nr:mariner Mos1 transposase [Trichonephila clavipes]
MLCSVYGVEALKERQCQNCYAKFRSGDFSLKDEKRSVRPVEVDDDLIKAIIDSDRHSTTLWWDYKGSVYFELLPPNQTINSDVYIEQLTKLNNAVEEKWPELTNQKGVVFHHGNARTHTSLVTRQKLLELGWDVLPHPPYSPDLAPSDYFCFDLYKTTSMVKISLMMMMSNRTCVIQLFANKNQMFYESGTMMLPERWQKVIDQNGKYITE